MCLSSASLWILKLPNTPPSWPNTRSMPSLWGCASINCRTVPAIGMSCGRWFLHCSAGNEMRLRPRSISLQRSAAISRTRWPVSIRRRMIAPYCPSGSVLQIRRNSSSESTLVRGVSRRVGVLITGLLSASPAFMLHENMAHNVARARFAVEVPLFLSILFKRRKPSAGRCYPPAARAAAWRG